MNEGVYLLDTNAAVALLNNDPEINALLSQAEIWLSSIALGELHYGAEKSGRVEENSRRVAEFASKRIILSCDAATAPWYGRIYQQLRAKGRPIPQNDVWIAAIAQQHDLVLIMRDAHFQHVDGLKMRSW